MGKTAYSSEVDMWSVGCILAELLIGKALFTGKDEPEQCDRIMRLCGSPKEENMPGCSSLPGYVPVCSIGPYLLMPYNVPCSGISLIPAPRHLVIRHIHLMEHECSVATAFPASCKRRCLLHLHSVSHPDSSKSAKHIPHFAVSVR